LLGVVAAAIVAVNSRTSSRRLPSAGSPVVPASTRRLASNDPPELEMNGRVSAV
jgi:hypothetical protein